MPETSDDRVAESPPTFGSDDRVSEPPPTFGADFSLSLACPKCGTTGWVALKHLKHSLRCSQCDSQLFIGRNGQLLAQADLPQVQYACPRCGQSGSLPALSLVKRAECTSCKLPLVRGPDQRLHGEKEAAELRRAASVSSPKRFGSKDREERPTLFRGGKLATVGLSALGILIGFLWVCGLLFSDSPEDAARRFTYACLEGNWQDAEEYLEQDSVEKAEFRRWRVRHFSSILDTHRPDGDEVDVRVEVLEQEPELLEFRVVLNSPFLGERDHRQRWRKHEGTWRFEAQETLAQQDAVARHATSRSATLPRGLVVPGGR